MSLLYKPQKSAADVDELLAQHKNLVYYMLSHMGQLTNQDAESAAWEALWDAINLYDVYSDTAFSTYACTLIRNAVNDVYRKQQTVEKQEQIVVEALSGNGLGVTSYHDSGEDTERIYQLFDEFISKKKGVTRNVLLVWRAYDFEIAATDIAKVCKCSISYVCRNQQLFRAYLSSRLK